MEKGPDCEALKQENLALRQRIKELEVQRDIITKCHDIPGGSLLFSIIQSLPLNIYAKNPDGYFIFVNDQYCRSVGKKAEDIIDKTDFDIHPPKLAEKYLNDDRRIMDSGKNESIEEEWQSIGGSKSFVRVIKTPIFTFNSSNSARSIIGTMGVFWDITKIKQAESALQKSEERYRRILQNIREGYFELDRNHVIQFHNEAFSAISGYHSEELVGTELTALAFPDSQKTVKRFLDHAINNQKEAETGDFVFLHHSGRPLTLNFSISPIKDDTRNLTGLRGIVRDITEAKEAENKRKQLEKQLTQAQKMESIGTLAGGIAHDFNNILFIIQGYTDLALSDLKKKNNPTAKLRKVRQACNRATILIEQILSFARHSEKKRVPTDIRVIIKEAAKLLRSALPSTINITTKISITENLLVIADPTEIHQVIMNLCTNAAQSIDGNNGSITISLDEISVDSELSSSVNGLSIGNHLLLKINDTGRGIPQDIIPRIFEPFFTTKKIGEGTGLGLSVVHGIITGTGGAIAVESSNHGSQFMIYLPVTLDSSSEQKKEPKSVLKGTWEHVLLVDDDEALLHMIGTMLTALNYTSTICSNGNEAFDCFTREPDKYDLLLTDQTMPGLTGEALSLAVRAIRPDIPIVLCTGFSERMSPERAAELGINEYLNKPILLEDLAETLFNVLHNRDGSSAIEFT